ncbi:MAG: metallophosphoesterase [Deltaproteobacteria bacterium]|nr:metallophosphoesterase [Deltaproteobacteria bacterium]
MSRRYKYLGLGLLVALATLIPGGFVIPRLLPPDKLGPIVFVTFLWLGLLFYLVLAFGLVDLGRMSLKLWRRLHRSNKSSAKEDSVEEPPESVGLNRRAFLARLTAGTAIASSGVISLVGIHSAFGEFDTPEVPVSLKRLPRAFSGFRIVLLSDLHLGPLLGSEFVERVVEKTNALNPDLIAITGDLVDMPVDLLGNEIQGLSKLQAPRGVFFVTGNHEYFHGVEQWIDFIRGLGINVLANQCVGIGDPDEPAFDLVGIHDRSAAYFNPSYKPDLKRALTNHVQDRELILLAHQPKQINDSDGMKIGLQLSGHTHGGQIWPFGGLTLFAQPYLSGLHQHDQHRQIYVTRGTGFWGPPIRVLAPPEITSIILTT